MKKQNTKPEKNKFRPRKLTGLDKIAARKAAIDQAPQMPNRDTSMRGGTSI